MQQTLRQKTVHGLLWSSIERFSVQGINFVVSILIARQLFPSEYGIIAMLFIFIAVSTSLVDCGFFSALVRKTDRSESDNATVFYFDILIGFLTMTVLFFSAPLIASFYEIPTLCPMARLVCVVLFFDSFCIVQRALLTANLDFKTQAKISLASVILSGIVGLWLAYAGWGVWALAWQMVTASFCRSLLFWLFTQWRPVKSFSKQSFHNLFGFGSKLLLSGLLDSLYKNIYMLVIGKIFSAASLGNYSRAKQIAFYPSSNLTDVLQRVTFPVLSTIKEDDERLCENYRLMLRLSAFVVFPLMIGLVIVAKPLIIWTLTPKWSEAVPLLQIISLSMMWYPIHAINLNLLQVKGRSDLFLRLEIIRDAIGVLFLCVTIPMGLLAVCWGQVLYSIIGLIINTHYTGKLIGVGFIRQISDLLPILLAVLVMSGVVYFFIGWIEKPWVQLFVGILSGAVVYIGIGWIFKMKELDYIIEIIKRK